MDAASLASIADLMDKKLDKIGTDLGNTMDSKMENMKKDLNQFNKDQAVSLGTTLKNGMKEIITSLKNRQDAFEEKSEQKLHDLGKDLAKRQDESDTKNESRLTAIEQQLSGLATALGNKANQFPPLSSVSQAPQSLSGPPPPGMLPEPQLPSPHTASSTAHRPAKSYSQDEFAKIRDIVHKAKFSVGFGPITPENINTSEGESQEDKIKSAAIYFMRNSLGVTEDEIKNEDVVNAFLPDDHSIPRVYVNLISHDQVEFCLELQRSLRKPELRVVKFIPREFRARNRTLEYESFILRKHTVPPFKVKIEYSEDDLVLTKCLLHQYTYTAHVTADLPPIDLGPQRPPPPAARKNKRQRSGDQDSPNSLENKKERVDSPGKVTIESEEIDTVGKLGAASAKPCPVIKINSVESSLN